MTNSMDASDARSALTTVEYSRRQVIAEIDMPRWYWLGLAAGWIGLGLVADVGPGWLAAVATLTFGAAHAAAAQNVLSGRRRSGSLSVRAELAGSHVSALVITFLVGLVVLTIAAALLIDADGANHPATIAGVMAAIAVALGGPELMATVRRRALRNVPR
jgi:hypothetical protein